MSFKPSGLKLKKTLGRPSGGFQLYAHVDYTIFHKGDHLNLKEVKLKIYTRQMLDKLDFLSGKYSELNIESIDPKVIIDHNQWNKIMEKQSHMQPIIEKYYEYTAVLTGIYETVNELITNVRQKSSSRNPKS